MKTPTKRHKARKAQKRAKRPRQARRILTVITQGRTKNQDAAIDAEIAFSPLAQHATIACAFLSPTMTADEVKPIAGLQEIRKSLDAIKAGNLACVEELHFMQATSLNAVYVEMTRRAGLSFGSTRQQQQIAEGYLRLAFKAQSQSRCALEALAELKNPRPIAFVKQANIAGQQQVNNAVPLLPVARAENSNGILANKVLGAGCEAQRVE